MKTIKQTIKTDLNPLSLRDLGGGIGFAVTSSSHIDTKPSAGVRQWHRRKALCVSDLQMRMGWHTAKAAAYWQITTVRSIIQPYSGKIWSRQAKWLNFALTK